MPTELVEAKSQFAKRIGVSAGRVSQFVARGLPLADNGRVRVDAALKWIRANVRPEPGRPEGSSDAETGNLNEVKIRHLLLQCERAELELSFRRGELLDRADAVAVMRVFARGFRDHMLNFANRHGPAMAAELGVKPAGFVGILESRIRDALTEFADAPNPFSDDKKDGFGRNENS